MIQNAIYLRNYKDTIIYDCVKVSEGEYYTLNDVIFQIISFKFMLKD